VLFQLLRLVWKKNKEADVPQGGLETETQEKQENTATSKKAAANQETGQIKVDEGTGSQLPVGTSPVGIPNSPSDAPSTITSAESMGSLIQFRYC
jgi:hypothetical protein